MGFITIGALPLTISAALDAPTRFRVLRVLPIFSLLRAALFGGNDALNIIDGGNAFSPVRFAWTPANNFSSLVQSTQLMNLIPLLARHHVLSELDLLNCIFASLSTPTFAPPMRNFWESILSQISATLGISCKELMF